MVLANDTCCHRMQLGNLASKLTTSHLVMIIEPTRSVPVHSDWGYAG